MNEEERRRELSYLETLTTAQSRQNIEDGRVVYQKQNLVFPPFLYHSTEQITQTPQESRGIILSTKQQADDKTFFIAQYMQVIGTGDAVSVFVDPQKRQAMMELIRRHPELKTTEFHCHTNQTGSAWEQKFSPGDYNTILKMRQKNPDYTHALFTPTHILTNGREKTSFVLARQDTDQTSQIETYQSFDEEYRDILARMK